MSLNDISILFSFGQKNKLIRYLCVFAKYYVYSNTFSGRGLDLEAFMSILKRRYQSEKYLANLSNSATSRACWADVKLWHSMTFNQQLLIQNYYSIA